MNPYLKIKTWYENKLFLYRVKRALKAKAKIKFYKYSLSYKIISIVKPFWFAHWQYIITTFLAILAIIAAAIVALFIHFDSKYNENATSKANQPNKGNISDINHIISSVIVYFFLGSKAKGVFFNT